MIKTPRARPGGLALGVGRHYMCLSGFLADVYLIQWEDGWVRVPR